MKIFGNILLSLLLSALVTSCADTENKVDRSAEAPSVVALKLYKGLTTGDVKVVNDNIFFQNKIDSTVFRDYFAMAVASKDYQKRTAGFNADYKVVSEKINGDEAVVGLEGMGPLGNYLKINVKLKLIDGFWKVDGNHGVYYTEFPEEKK